MRQRICKFISRGAGVLGGSAKDYFAGLECSDNAAGIAVLYRRGSEVARTTCTMFPVSWFEALQEHSEVGDMVQVFLGTPLNRVERFYMATANHNGFVTGFCTERQWNWKPVAKVSRAALKKPT